MSVAGVLKSPSSQTENLPLLNLNIIEATQALTAIVRPVLSLASAGFTFVSLTGAGAVCAGLFAASDSRLSGFERGTEGAKAAFGFVPLIGPAIQLVDGLYQLATYHRVGSEISASKSEAQSALLWGAVGLALDGIFRFKGKTIKDGLRRVVDEVGVPIPGGCTVRMVSSDGSSLLRGYEESFRNALKNAGFSMGYEVNEHTCFALMNYQNLNRLVMKLENIEDQLQSTPLNKSSFHDLVLRFYQLARRALSERPDPMLYLKNEKVELRHVA